MDLFSSPPKVSPAEILWMMEELPDTSAVKRDPEREGGMWQIDVLLLACILNAVKENTTAFIQAHSKKNVPPPKPVLPPGLEKQHHNKAVRNGDDIFF